MKNAKAQSRSIVKQKIFVIWRDDEGEKGLLFCRQDFFFREENENEKLQNEKVDDGGRLMKMFSSFFFFRN